MPVRLSRCILLLPVLLALASVLRPQGRTGLWLDEIYSLLLSRGEGYRQLTVPCGEILAVYPDPTSLDGAGSLFGIWAGQAQDAHPPLYFVMLRLWREVFGESVMVARAYSVFCFAGATLLITLAAYRLTSQIWAALGSGTVMALSVSAAWYGQEIRDYSQLLLVLAVVLLAHAHLLRRPTWAWTFGYVLAVTAAGLTHYLAIGVVFPSILTLLVSLDRIWRGRMTWGLVGAAIVYGAIWGPFAVNQARNSVGMTAWAQGHWQLLYARFESMLAVSGGAIGVPYTSAWLLGIGLLLLFAVMSRRSSRRRDWAMVAAVTFGPAVLLLVGDLAASGVTSWWTRFLLAALPGTALVAGLLASEAGRLRFTAWVLPFLSLLSQVNRPAFEMNYPSVVRESRELGLAKAVVFVVPDKTSDVDIETSVRTLAMMYAAHAGKIVGPVVLLDRPSPVVEQLGATILVISAWADFNPVEYFPGYRLTQPRRFWPGMNVRVMHLVRKTDVRTDQPTTRP